MMQLVYNRCVRALAFMRHDRQYAIEIVRLHRDLYKNYDVDNFDFKVADREIMLH